jgi:hypothetical protein
VNRRTYLLCTLHNAQDDARDDRVQAARLDPAETSNLVRDALANLQKLVDERIQLGPESKLKDDKREKSNDKDMLIASIVVCTIRLPCTARQGHPLKLNAITSLYN